MHELLSQAAAAVFLSLCMYYFIVQNRTQTTAELCVLLQLAFPKQSIKYSTII